MFWLGTAVAIAAVTNVPATAETGINDTAEPCAAVFPIDDNYLYLDLGHRYYSEYRTLPFMVAPREHNPAGYRLVFSLIIDHDIDSDAMIGAEMVAEARDPSTDAYVATPEAPNSKTDVWIDGNGSNEHLRLSDLGDTVGLIDNKRDISHPRPDALGGRAIYDRAIRGGSIQFRFHAASADFALDAETVGTFPANPSYQAKLRAKAREMTVEQARTGKCPLEKRG